MQESWIKWEPTAELAKKYRLYSIVENAEENFQIVLSELEDENKKVIIEFQGLVDAYRLRNLEFCQNTLHYLNEKYGHEFYQDWTFFKIDNSHYVELLSKKLNAFYETFQTTHFCIITEEVIIDIIDWPRFTIKFIQ